MGIISREVWKFKGKDREMEIVKLWESAIVICSECDRETAYSPVCPDCQRAIMEEIYAESAR